MHHIRRFATRLKFFIVVISIFVIFLVINQVAWSQDIKATAVLDTNSIQLGDQINLTLFINQGQNKKITFPGLSDTVIKGIEILGISKIDTLKDGVLSEKLIVTAFDDSVFSIPPFKFLVGTDTVFTNPLKLKVGRPRLDSALVKKIDTTQTFAIFDVKAPIGAPWTLKEFLKDYYPYLLGGLFLILLVIGIFYYLKWRKDKKPLIKFEKPKEPIHVIALRRLDELKEKKLWQRGLYKEYHSELTDIIRGYIEERYMISALELTSHEILALFTQAKQLSDEIFNYLSYILSIADMAKFAKAQPLPTENETSLQNAYTFIEKTKVEKIEQNSLSEQEIEKVN
jgi:hypothetical protein